MEPTIIIAIIIFFSGICLIIYFFKILFIHLFVISKWKKVEGRILLAEPKFHQSERDPDHSGWKKYFCYKYIVNDKEYINHVLSKNIQFLYPFEEWVENIDYTINESIEVIYNPQHPQESVIDKKFSYLNLLYILMAALSFYVAYTILPTTVKLSIIK